MKVGSLFAGIGGFDLAAERAGMEVVWQSEFDPKASTVLDHHWPTIPNYGDIHGIRNLATVDVLTGGFPCQDYSVAGLRGGLAGDRGALWWEYHRLIARLRPTWVVGENVPGLLSSRGGADFETIIGSLTECGYGVAWAVLDAQYFGVAQRRRRVFIVGHSGGEPRPEVLALGEGVFGDSPPSREKGEGVAPTLASRTRGGGGLGTDFDLDGGLIAFPWQADAKRKAYTDDGTTPTLPANQSLAVAFSAGNHESSYGIGLSVEHTPPLRAGESGTNQVPTIAFSSKDHGADAAEDVAPTLRAMAHRGSHVNGGGQVAVAIQSTLVGRSASAGPNGAGVSTDVMFTIDTREPHAVAVPGRVVVRRLTPLECERLQGFPDNWTAIPGNSDTQRYRQLGNAVAVPVVEWIMRRIVEAS